MTGGTTEPMTAEEMQLDETRRSESIAPRSALYSSGVRRTSVDMLNDWASRSPSKSPTPTRVLLTSNAINTRVIPLAQENASAIVAARR